MSFRQAGHARFAIHHLDAHLSPITGRTLAISIPDLHTQLVAPHSYMELMMNWKPVKGFEIQYSVSDTGLVRSNERLSLQGHVMPEKIMKTAVDKSGYVMVNLRTGSFMKRVKVHRLVADAFIPKLQGKKFINHIDGNKSNNEITNLEWCTASENSKHSTHCLGNKPKGRLPKENTTTRNNEIKEYIDSVGKHLISQTSLVKKFRIGYSTASKLLEA